MVIYIAVLKWCSVTHKHQALLFRTDRRALLKKSDTKNLSIEKNTAQGVRRWEKRGDNEIRIERDVVNAKSKSNRTEKNFDINYLSSETNTRRTSFSSLHSKRRIKQWKGTDLRSSNPIILPILYFQQRHKSFPKPDVQLVHVFYTPHILIIEPSYSVTIHGVLNWML